MRLFVNDDRGYLDWVSANPSGYVLNSYAHPSTDYLMLHKATCGSITSAARLNYTSGGYVKVCAPDIGPLEAWASEETGGRLSPCGLCKPEYFAIRDADIHGFEYWVRGYQNFYEPIILAHFRDQGWQATKENSTIEKGDLKCAAEKLAQGERKCTLSEDEKQDCIKLFRTRTRIQTDGILRKKDKEGRNVAYSVECKSWGGFCSAGDTLKYFLGAGGWFMLVDRIRGSDISGSVLVVGGSRPDDHDQLVAEIAEKYARTVEVYYLHDIFANPGPEMKKEINRQLARLDRCVENIKKDLKRW